MRTLVSRFAAFALALSAVGADAQPALRIDADIISSSADLPSPIPAAINDAGVIVGNAGPQGTTAFVWTRKNGFRTIAEDATAIDINNRGEVVGSIVDCTNVCDLKGFLWTANTGVQIFPSFIPRAINNKGEMAGTCVPDLFACRRVNGAVVRIPLSDCCDSLATAINDRGDVVGLGPPGFVHGDRFLRMFLFSARSGSVTFLSSGDEAAIVQDINNTETVVGWLRDGDVPFATFWRSGRRTSAAFPSEAYAISDAGRAVGVRVAEDGVATTAVLWTTPGRALPLAVPHATISRASDINESGEIAGSFIAPSGEHQMVVWRIRTPLHVDTPNTTARWGLNTRQRLAWTYVGDASQFLIEMSRDSGKTWTDLATVANNPGESQNFEWRVTGPLTSAAKFRVTASGDSTATDINDADVAIANAAVEVLSPTKTTSVQLGSPLTVSYKHTLGARAPVLIEVSADNGTSWRTVAETTTNGSSTSSFIWAVDLLPTATARIRIQALDGSAARAVSRAFVVTAPTGR